MDRVSVETQTSNTLVNSNPISILSKETPLENKSITKYYKIIKECLLTILFRTKMVILNNLMLILITISAAIGIGLGFILRSCNFSSNTIMYFGFPGELFVRALKFITLPLIFCNLIAGVSGLVNKTKKVAITTVLFIFFSIFSSIAVGFLLVLTIKPGKKISFYFFNNLDFNTSHKSSRKANKKL